MSSKVYKVRAPNGKVYKVKAPNGTSDEELYQYLMDTEPELMPQTYTDIDGAKSTAPPKEPEESAGFLSNLATGVASGSTATGPAMMWAKAAEQAQDSAYGGGLNRQVMEEAARKSGKPLPEENPNDLRIQARDYAAQRYRENMAEAQEYKSRPGIRDNFTDEVNGVGDFIDYVGYHTGETLGQLAPTLAATFLSRGRLAPFGAPAGAALGYAQGSGEGMGQAIDTADAEGRELGTIDMTDVNRYGGAAGGLEILSDAAMGALGKTPVGKLLSPLIEGGSNMVSRGVRRFVTGGAAEAPIEMLQTGLGDMAAGKDVDEANWLDFEAGMAGFVGGGGVKTIIGGLTPSETDQNDPNDPNDPNADPVSPEAQAISDADDWQNQGLNRPTDPNDPNNTPPGGAAQQTPLSRMQQLEQNYRDSEEQDRQQKEAEREQLLEQNLLDASYVDGFLEPEQYRTIQYREVDEKLNNKDSEEAGRYALWRANQATDKQDKSLLIDTPERRDQYLNEVIIPELREDNSYNDAVDEFVASTREVQDALNGVETDAKDAALAEIQEVYDEFRAEEQQGNTETAQDIENRAIEQFGAGGWALIKATNRKNELAGIKVAKSEKAKEVKAAQKKAEKEQAAKLKADQKKLEKEQKLAQKQAERQARIDALPDEVKALYEAEKEAGSDADIEFYTKTKEGKDGTVHNVFDIIKRARDEFGPEWATELPNVNAALSDSKYELAGKNLASAIKKRNETTVVTQRQKELKKLRDKSPTGIVPINEMNESERDLANMYLGLDSDGTPNGKPMSLELIAKKRPDLTRKRVREILYDELGLTATEAKKLMAQIYTSYKDDQADSAVSDALALFNKNADKDGESLTEAATLEDVDNADIMENDADTVDEAGVAGMQDGSYSVVQTEGGSGTSIGEGTKWRGRFVKAHMASDKGNTRPDYTTLAEKMTDEQLETAAEELDGNADLAATKRKLRIKSNKDKKINSKDYKPVSYDDMDAFYLAVQLEIANRRKSAQQKGVEGAAKKPRKVGVPTPNKLPGDSQEAWNYLMGGDIAWERTKGNDDGIWLNEAERRKVREIFKKFRDPEDTTIDNVNVLKVALEEVAEAATVRIDTKGMSVEDTLAYQKERLKQKKIEAKTLVNKRSKTQLKKEVKRLEKIKAEAKAAKEKEQKLQAAKKKLVEQEKLDKAKKKAALDAKRKAKEEADKLKTITDDPKYKEQVRKKGKKNIVAYLMSRMAIPTEQIAKHLGVKRDTAFKNIVKFSKSFYELARELGITQKQLDDVLHARYPEVKEIEVNVDDVQDTQEEGTNIDEEADAELSDALAKFKEAGKKTKHSKGQQAGSGTSVKAVKEALKPLVSDESFNDNVTVYQTAEEAQAANPDVDVTDSKGWVDEAGRVHLIADNIEPGNELGVLMHEIGSHLGIDEIHGKDVPKFAKRIRQLAKSGNGLGKAIATAAMLRMEAAGVDSSQQDSELVAYFIEAAVDLGVRPQQLKSKTGRLFGMLAKMYRSMKNAVRKMFGKDVVISEQDMVDLAFGAARVVTKQGHRMSNPNMIRYSKTYAARAVEGVENTIGSFENAQTRNIGWRALGAMRTAIDVTKPLHAFIKDVRDRMPAAEAWNDAIDKADMYKQELRDRAYSIAARAKELTPERLALVNQFLSMSTLHGKWGYDPTLYDTPREDILDEKGNPKKLFIDKDGNPLVVDVDPRFKEAFDMLNQYEKQLVIDIFAHGEHNLQLKAQIAKELKLDTNVFDRASRVPGPYAPLKRYGSEVAWAKSEEVVKLEKEIKVDKENDNVDPKKAKKLQTLKEDPKHYQISFFENIGVAKEWAAERKKEGFLTKTYTRHEASQRDMSSAPGLQEALGALKVNQEDFPKGAAVAFRDMLIDLYLDKLDDTNARQQSRKRKGYAGFDENMLRSFMDNAIAESNLVANLKYGKEINENYKEANKQSRDPDDEKGELANVFNRISQHYGKMLDYQGSTLRSVYDFLTTLTAVHMLLTNVAYYMQNATQVWAFTAPRLGAIFGDWKKAMRLSADNYKWVNEVASMNWKTLELEVDITKVPAKYHAAIEDLKLKKLLDVGMEEDMGTFKSSQSGIPGVDKAKEVMTTVTSKLYQVARFGEVVNRVVTVITAIDMAEGNSGIVKKLGFKSIDEFAVAMVQDTQGDFSRKDTPYLLKFLPRPMVQFRKYQIMSMWQYLNAAHEAFMNEDAEVRAVGRRTLGMLTAHAVVLGGLRGSPITYLLLLALIAGFSDDDEPDDMEVKIRDVLGDNLLTDVISNGGFSAIGVDMQSKLSQHNIFHPFPYGDMSSPESTAFSAIGPFGAVFSDYWKAGEEFGKGNYIKSAEKILPKGLARFSLQTLRENVDGVTLSNGTQVVSPQELNILEDVATIMGLSSGDRARIGRQRSNMFEITKWYKDNETDIRNSYKIAKDNGESVAMRRLHKDFMAIQKSKKDMRKFFGNDWDALQYYGPSALNDWYYGRKDVEKQTAKRYSNKRN